MAKARNRKRSTRLEDSEAVAGRFTRVEELEWEREKIKAEIEKIMSQYAKISGRSALAFRRYNLGKSSNDYKFD